MRAPAFWWDPAPSPVARLLAPLGRIYGGITALRMRQPGAPGPVPILCVGNFTVGGAGKTPVALALGQLLIEAGEEPAFLSRGYGGSHRGGPHRVDPTRDSAALVGDEPLLLAACAKTFVTPDRVAGAAACAAARASVIILDDGLQNPSLKKTLSLAVVDGGAGIGNGLCLPAGPLRASLEAQWSWVDAVIVVGDGAPGAQVAGAARALGKPVFDARLVPAMDASRLAGQRVFAFAGIGRPGKFYSSLRAVGAEIVGTRDFPDHHGYTASDVEQIRSEAGRLGAMPVTTEKDRVRLAGQDGIETFKVELQFADRPALSAFVTEAVRTAAIRRR
jgi:tetraacyldisaccharide 4'-kinase